MLKTVYREAQRSSGQSPKAFATNSIISLLMLAGLATFALATNL